MAKNSSESTAVNELIERVQTQKPLPADPADDLLFRVPEAAKTTNLRGPHRLGKQISAVVAGEVAPLPRHRTPTGTNQESVIAPSVRVSTAQPARGTTIPPLSHPKALPAVERRATLPPPHRNSQPLAAVDPASVTMLGTGARPVLPRATGPTSTLMGHGPLAASLPPEEPVEAPLELPPEPVAPPTFDASVHPFAAPAVQRSSVPAHPIWVDRPERGEQQHEETWVGTVQVQRRTNWKQLAGKLAGPMVILIVLGVFIGGYFAFDGEGGKKRNPKKQVAASQAITPIELDPASVPPPVAPAPPAEPVKAEPPAQVAQPEPEPEPEPTPEPEPAKAEPPAPAVAPTALVAKTEPSPLPAALVDVRIDSTPAGATVMLVDRGKTTFLGNTPLATALDPTRTYELVFSHTNKPTHIEKLDPAETKRVAVTLGKRTTTRARTARADAAEPAAGGEGVLMISSKPPCEIFVDGKPTGLTTPQRSIPLPAGSHKITLVNKAEGIKKTLAVQITADTATKVIQDLMK